jgi:hypothetical protein
MSGSIVSLMAFLVPLFIIAVVFLAAPQIGIGLVIVVVGAGLSAAITRLPFGRHPLSR